MDGDYHYDTRKGQLLWSVELVDDSNRAGSLEFVLAANYPPDAFFPVDVSFAAQHTLADVRIAQVGACPDSAERSLPLRTILGMLRSACMEIVHEAPDQLAAVWKCLAFRTAYQDACALCVAGCRDGYCVQGMQAAVCMHRCYGLCRPALRIPWKSP